MSTPFGRKREKTFCRAFYVEAKLPAQIRDISKGGFKLTFFTDPKLSLDQNIQVRIIPEQNGESSPFTVEAVVRWLENDSHVFNAGLEIFGSEQNSNRYAALLLD